MKTFILAIIFVVLIVGTVIADILVTDKFTDGLTAQVQAMPEEYDGGTDPLSAVEALKADWERARKYLTVTVNYGYITVVNTTLESYIAAIKTEDEVDYATHRRNLLLALENLRKFGSISAETVF
jgi:hypothetical protein